MFFFFKQKTAYEMRISDWSSDVCSSDLHLFAVLRGQPRNVPVPVVPALKAIEPARLPGICLGDAALQEHFRKALRVFERDVPLLIHGETGSGKEAFAKAVHHASQRAGKNFVALNCAAIPESLIEDRKSVV